MEHGGIILLWQTERGEAVGRIVWKWGEQTKKQACSNNYAGLLYAVQTHAENSNKELHHHKAIKDTTV